MAALLLAGAPPALAQADNTNSIHWAYSTYFGSGWYRIGAQRDAFALRFAPRKVVREASIGDEGQAVSGAEVRFPVTVGLDQFPLNDLAGTVDLGNLANVSFTPGVYFDIPVNTRWSLRPFAAAGWGTVLDGGESAWSYWAGLRSRRLLGRGNVRTALVNSAGFVGYSPSNGSSANFWPVMTAVELSHPLVALAGGDELRLDWHLAYTFFAADFDVLARDAASDPIADQWELGLAVSRRERRMNLWFFTFERVGLAFRTSSDGKLKGIGLVFHSLYDQ